jgi:mannitol-specific phosphotransferase system IIBC component
MDSSAFNRRIPPDFEMIILAMSIILIMCVTVITYFQAIPNIKDFQCTESAIVNGVPECVEYRRNER